LSGFFRKSALIDPPSTTLVLVDHNEYAQAVRGVEEANVMTDIAGVDAAQFTHDFFASGSLLTMGSVDEMIGTDRKQFNEGGKFISISQVEEMDLDRFTERTDEMITSLERLISNKGYDIALLVVTDITKHHSKIVVVGDRRIIEALPFKKISENVLDAAGVVSRKKQIFPAVSNAIQGAAATSLESL